MFYNSGSYFPRNALEGNMGTVLVIDDDLILSDLYNAYLQVGGMDDWETYGEIHIEPALKFIEARQPDIVFLDNRLPPYDDYREPIKKIFDTGYAGPIVVQSACIEDEVFDSAINLGASLVREKWKVSNEEFLKILKDLVIDTNALLRNG